MFALRHYHPSFIKWWRWSEWAWFAVYLAGLIYFAAQDYVLWFDVVIVAMWVVLLIGMYLRNNVTADTRQMRESFQRIASQCEFFWAEKEENDPESPDSA